MKENQYDDPNFFAEYRQFPRSVAGLSAAGEWHELRRMLPDFKGKRVLDIGCGFGWHCIYAAEQGAKKVIGTDISEKMLAVAQEKTQAKNVHYQQIAMEDLAFPEGSFEVVISSLAFHYTPDFALICQKVADFLTPGGSFVFSVEHPVFTAEGSQDWTYDEKGQIIDWPVDNYFTEGRRETNFLGETVVKYHKTLTTYLNSLLQSGFVIKEIVEPMPEAKLLAEVAAMKDELRRPMMLLVAAEKK